MDWTKQQERAIEAPIDNILVSAAAGSGKTAVLTERIKRLVVEQHIPVEKMLVLTFTNAAAGEMKEKIVKALREAEQQAYDNNDRETVDFVRTQLRNIPSADISTFHKFLMGVIRQYFYLTDIDQDFRVCDDAQQVILRDKCLDDMLGDRFAAGDEDFLKFADAYSGIKGTAGAKRMIISVYDFIMNMEDPFGWLHENVEKLNCSEDDLLKSDVYHEYRKAVSEKLKKALKYGDAMMELIGGYPDLGELTKKSADNLMSKARSNVNAVKAAAAEMYTMPDDSLREALDIQWVQMRAKKHEKASFDIIKDDVKFLNDGMKQCVKEAAELLPETSPAESAEKIAATYPFAQTLENLVNDFSLRFAAEKKSKKVVDYSDIEHVAYGILTNKEHTEAAETYKSKYDAIFIDEYQDSSRIQEAIIRSVSRGRNVYMVGDVKQSIYKFRQADPDIFIGKYNSYNRTGEDADGRLISLNMNFRSKSGVIDSVNGVFRNVMTMEKTGIAYDDAAELHKGSVYETGGELDYGASLHIVEGMKKDDVEQLTGEIGELTAAEAEGEMIAELAAERLGKPVFDDKLQAVRKAGYEDIVILLRSRTNADIYAKALRDRGLPAYIAGGEGYFETYEVEMFMNLLRVIDNRRRDTELISVLRSPVRGFGFSIEELAGIRLYDEKCAYSEAFSRLADEGKTKLALKCHAAVQQLDNWRVEARYMPLPEFIWKLMVDTDLLNYAAALPGGAQRTANLRLLVDKAGEFTRNQGEGLFSFVNYIERVKQSRQRAPQASYEGDISNMIQIMTVHKSKGLEFPIVFVSNLAANIRHDTDMNGMQLHKNLGLALKFFDTAAHTSFVPVNYSAIEDVKRREDFEEEKRILYVAMTRAKDELIMTANVRSAEKTLKAAELADEMNVQSDDSRIQWVLSNAAEAGIDVIVHDAVEFAGDAVSKTESRINIMREISEGFPEFKDEHGMIAAIQKRFDSQYPYVRETLTKSKFTVTGINRMLRGESDERRPHMLPSDVGSELYENDVADEKYEESEIAAKDVQGPETPAEDQAACDMPDEGDVPRFLRGESKIAPARRGTLTHKILELIDYSEKNDEKRIREFTRSLVGRGLMTEEEASAVSYSDIASFFSSELGKRACRAVKRRNEWAFTMKKSTAELAAEADSPEISRAVADSLPSKILIQGVIDCAFRDESGIVVIDFKTDWCSAADERNGFSRFKKLYGRQIELYCEVVEKEYGEPVERASLFMLRAGREVVIKQADLY